MAGVERLEDLLAWKKARVMTREVYLATREGPFARDFGLAGQIQRSSVSITGNIAEGFERRHRAEFAQFVNVARGSCGETRSHLSVALDVGYLAEGEFVRLKGMAAEAGRIAGGLHDTVQRRRG